MYIMLKVLKDNIGEIKYLVSCFHSHFLRETDCVNIQKRFCHASIIFLVQCTVCIGSLIASVCNIGQTRGFPLVL